MNNNGFVQLPLEVYDNMQEAITRLQNELDHSIARTRYDELSEILSSLVTIRDYYGDARPMLIIDIKPLAPWIDEALLDSEFGEDYELKDTDSFLSTLTSQTCFTPTRDLD